jgi:hypothetical protein
LKELWKDLNIRTQFYTDICIPAIEAISIGYFHGDIRPMNICFNEETKRFQLIDWDSVCKVEISRDDNRGDTNKVDWRYPYLDISNDKHRSRLFTFYQLYHTIRIIDEIVQNYDQNILLSIWNKKEGSWKIGLPEIIFDSVFLKNNENFDFKTQLKIILSIL